MWNGFRGTAKICNLANKKPKVTYSLINVEVIPNSFVSAQLHSVQELTGFTNTYTIHLCRKYVEQASEGAQFIEANLFKSTHYIYAIW